MKASSVLLTVFSGLAIAAPALEPRQNVDKLNAALNALNDKNGEIKKNIETSIEEQRKRKEEWKERSTKQVELVKNATDLANGEEQRELLTQLADLINVADKKADEAKARLEKQKQKREAENQAYVNIANDFKAAIQG